MSDVPKLRDGGHAHPQELYPLGMIPADVVTALCGDIVYLAGTGRSDMTGNDFGDAFANAIGGEHFGSPVGIADVGLGEHAWSAKTVKINNPLDAKNVRLISGRNSPDYSFGVQDPHKDVQKTGDMVLKIWNERINIALGRFRILRTIVLLRNSSLTNFALFEEDIHQVSPADYTWKTNEHGNFVAEHRLTGKTSFTWQPHGSQFTMHVEVPAGAIRFSLQRPTALDKKSFLLNLHYDKSWIHVFNSKKSS